MSPSTQTRIDFPIRKQLRSRLHKKYNLEDSSAIQKLNDASKNPRMPEKTFGAVRKTRACVKDKLKDEKSSMRLSHEDKLNFSETICTVSPKNKKSIESLRTPIKEVNLNKTIKTQSKRQKENMCKENEASPPKREKRFNENEFTQNGVSKLKNKVVCSLKFCNDGDVYQKAKQDLHTACPDRILGRDKEIRQISLFLDDHIGLKNKPGNLYISGPPGTGKTACLLHVIKALELKNKIKPIFINCMSLKQSQGIFAKLASEIDSKSKRTGKEAAKFLEKTFTSAGPMKLVILDEIDHLDSKNQDVLYSIFEWSNLKKSRLVLIGIANSLDLTDRVLPRLKACNISPKLLNFPPYNKDQIHDILLDRLQKASHNGQCLFKPLAIQFCARKVAACAGDMRKALDICRRAIELVEADIRRPVLKQTADDGTNPGSPKKSPASMSSARKISSSSFKPVDLAQISSVLKCVYDSRVISNTESFSRTFPLQQKILIGTLLLMIKKGKNKEVTVGQLHDVYCRVCKIRQITQVDQSEFNSLCGLVESRGIVEIRNNKERRLSKINLKIDENEVEFVLQDQSLLSAILHCEECLKN